jgi:Alpha/beta hydrolase domain
MSSQFNRQSFFAKIASFAALLVLGFTSAEARVVEVNVTKSSNYGNFRAGEFVRLEGEIKGELSADESIPGLMKVTPNANGKVEYRTPFVVILPAQNAKGNGAVLVDVPNRGRPISHFLYNSAREKFLPLELDARTGFLQHAGFTVGMVQWELGQGIVIPSFVDEKGGKRFVEGVGLAAIRDFAEFMRNLPPAVTQSSSDFTQFANGKNRPTRVLAVGYSQTARLLKTLLIEGFNTANDKRVFDGLHLHASASGLADILVTGKGPASSTFFTPRFTHPEHRGVTELPLSYSDIVAKIKSPIGSEKPLLVVTNATTDYYNIRASLARTGAGGMTDLPIPSNVRIYDIAGASHGRQIEKTCDYAPGQLDFFPVLRTSLLHLDHWVAKGKLPPASRLMPLEPQPSNPMLLQAPLHLAGAIVQVPKQDADGNSVGGVRLPDLDAPLGTHGTQNPPMSDRGCNLNAGYIPFAKSDSLRASNDQRKSLQQRYRTQSGYLTEITRASKRLVRERFLLEEDSLAIVNAARLQTESFDFSK